jgi:hypothetical protein
MTKKIFKTPRFLFCGMFLAVGVWFGGALMGQAAPSISGVSGSVSNENSVVVSGGEFGVKSPAAPILWETFESGTAGQLLSKDPKWKPYGGRAGGLYNNSAAYSGSLAAFNDPKNRNMFDTNNFFFPNPETEIYYSYMARWDSENKLYPSATMKWGRLHVGNSTYGGAGAVLYSPHNPCTGCVVPSCPKAHTFSWWDWNDDYTQYSWSPPIIPISTWARQEMYSKLSTPGVSDGKLWAAQNNNTFADVTLMNRASHINYQHTNIILGLMAANTDLVGGSPCDYSWFHMWIDDVYIDNTFARVEVCEGNAWATRKKCDPQIPSAWSNSSITFTANQGSFTSGQNAYLYVVDKDGNVNASGYPITIGGSSSISIPGDINKDGVVNIFDYNILLQNFGATNCGNVADLNGDCVVNIFDYNVLLQNFGRTQ